MLGIGGPRNGGILGWPGSDMKPLRKATCGPLDRPSWNSVAQLANAKSLPQMGYMCVEGQGPQASGVGMGPNSAWLDLTVIISSHKQPHLFTPYSEQVITCTITSMM